MFNLFPKKESKQVDYAAELDFWKLLILAGISSQTINLDEEPPKKKPKKKAKTKNFKFTNRPRLTKLPPEIHGIISLKSITENKGVDQVCRELILEGAKNYKANTQI